MGTWRLARCRQAGSAHTRLVAGVAVCSLALSTGCAANFGAQTNVDYQPAEGVSDRTGDVYAINTLVVADDGGNGTVVVSLINTEPEADRLVTVTAEDSEGSGVKVSPLPRQGIELESQMAVDTAADGVLRLTGDSVAAGRLVALTFGFETAAPLRVEVPVVAAGETYAEVPLG